MKISFIIPTYNEAKGITKTLQQFQNLRGTDIEVIVSDNGSTDETLELAKNLADQLVKRPTNQRTTIGACRNRGAQVATGDILWFIDADVRIPDLENIYPRIMQSFSNVKIVAATMRIAIYLEEAKFWDNFWFGFVNICTFVQNRILKTGGSPGDCQIIRRTIFEQLQGFDTSLATSEDHELFHRLAKQGEIAMFWHYHIEMSARRVHRDGWPKVLWQWGCNWFNQFVLGKKDNSQWEARR